MILFYTIIVDKSEVSGFRIHMMLKGHSCATSHTTSQRSHEGPNGRSPSQEAEHRKSLESIRFSGAIMEFQCNHGITTFKHKTFMATNQISRIEYLIFKCHMLRCILCRRDKRWWRCQCHPSGQFFTLKEWLHDGTRMPTPWLPRSSAEKRTAKTRASPTEMWLTCVSAPRSHRYVTFMTKCTNISKNHFYQNSFDMQLFYFCVSLARSVYMTSDSKGWLGFLIAGFSRLSTLTCFSNRMDATRGAFLWLDDF